MHQIFISIFFILISLPKNTYAGNKQPSLDQNTLQSQKLFPINKWQSLNLLKQWRVSTTEIQSNPYLAPHSRLNTLTSKVPTLLFLDNNQNNIPDHFEMSLLKDNQQVEYIAIGILAAQTWISLLTLSPTADNNATNNKILNHIINIDACYEQLVHLTDTTSPILLFFNTVKKRNNKTKIQRHILQHFPSNSWRVFSNPCTVFQTLYQQNHQSILLYTPRKIAKEKSQ